MPHNITEVDTHSTVIVVPDAGETVSASNVSDVAQALGNRTNNHNTHGLWDSLKKGSGNLLRYLIGNAGSIELMLGGKIKALLGSKIELSAGSNIESTAADSTYVQLNGRFTRNGALVSQGSAARTVRRVSWCPNNASSNISVTSDKWFIPTGIGAGSYTRTIKTTGSGTTPEDGETITILRMGGGDGSGPGGNTELIKSETGLDLFIFDPGEWGYVELTYSVDASASGEWVPGPWGIQDFVLPSGSGIYGN